MIRVFHSDFYHRYGWSSTRFLALCFTAGLLSGASVFYVAGPPLLPLMRGILKDSMSIIGLLSVTFLPFLVSAFAVYICEPWLLYCVCFTKGLVFSFCSAAIMMAFGSAGWLFRWLLMFSELISLPFLYWFWQRHISSERGFSIAEFLSILCWLTLIGSVDYCCVTPFLAVLIKS